MQNWTEIYTKTSPLIKGVCRRYVKDLQLAEDITQEAFITAIEKVDSFSGKGSIEGWIRRIAVNKCLEHLQKNKNHFEEINQEKYAEEINQEIMSTNPKQKIINTDFTNEELISVIDKLPEHHKQVFNMYVIDKISHQEISETLNISLGTSKSHLSRARQKVQEHLLKIANEKQEEKRKRRGIFFLLPISFFTDQLFANQLQNYSVSLSSSVPDFITKASSIPIKLTPKKGLSTSSSFIIGACILSIISFSVHLSMRDNANSSIPSSSEETNQFIDKKMEENTKYNLPIKIAIDSTKENETLLFDSSVNSVAKKVESSPSSKSEKSIIKNTSHSSKEKEDDKQKIIIKKSVYIKDTMYLPN